MLHAAYYEAYWNILWNTENLLNMIDFLFVVPFPGFSSYSVFIMTKYINMTLSGLTMSTVPVQ